MKFFTLLIITVLSLHCYGPGLSEKYVCKENQRQTDYSFNNCFFIYLLKKNPTEEDKAIVTYCAKVYDDKCKNKSSVKPWWL
ncbi:hypothetical protein CH381_26970 [Leptospira sp. mixed culture ATI2-C-A1]|nr:hypothetical protein CH381_26970 [Leptospira sp. mixed culture ATI2-C-A1]